MAQAGEPLRVSLSMAFSTTVPSTADLRNPGGREQGSKAATPSSWAYLHGAGFSLGRAIFRDLKRLRSEGSWCLSEASRRQLTQKQPGEVFNAFI